MYHEYRYTVSLSRRLLVLCFLSLVWASLSFGGESVAYVASLDSDTVSVIDLGTKEVIVKIPVGHTPRNIAVSQDGLFAYVTEEGSDTLAVIDTRRAEVKARIPVGRMPRSVIVSPDGH